MILHDWEVRALSDRRVKITPMASRWAGVSVAQLGRLLEVLAEGVTVTAPNGQLLFANAAALERMGLTLERALASSPAELLARFDITDEDGRAVDPESFPGRRVLRGEQPAPLLLRLVDRATGRRFWTLVKATEFEDDEGRPLAVNVLEDVTDAGSRNGGSGSWPERARCSPLRWTTSRPFNR